MNLNKNQKASVALNAHYFMTWTPIQTSLLRNKYELFFFVRSNNDVVYAKWTPMLVDCLDNGSKIGSTKIVYISMLVVQTRGKRLLWTYLKKQPGFSWHLPLGRAQCHKLCIAPVQLGLDWPSQYYYHRVESRMCIPVIALNQKPFDGSTRGTLPSCVRTWCSGSNIDWIAPFAIKFG